MVIVVPSGDINDATRIPSYYNDTFEYLAQIGFEEITIDIVSEDQDDRYDPKGKSRFARPFKPALYLE